MRLLLCSALLAEAGPVIRHFRLKALSGTPFKVFENDEIRLVISGRGSAAAAAATSYLLATTSPAEAIINIGAFHHLSLPAGTLVFVKKVKDRFVKDIFEPAALPSFETGELAAGVDFAKEPFEDVEAFGFCLSAFHYLKSANIYCLRVVVGSVCENFSLLTEKNIYETIEKKMPEIETVLETIKKGSPAPVENEELCEKKQALKEIIENLDFFKKGNLSRVIAR